MPVILEVNFDWDVTEEEAAKFSTPDKAKVFWAVPGLLWKIWIRDPETGGSGGVYLFRDRASAEKYRDGPIVEAVRNYPKSSNHTVRIFDVREDVTGVTGGPIDVEMERGEIPPEIAAMLKKTAA